MKKETLIILILFLNLFFSSQKTFAQDLILSKNDRILIIAPHPDDETIGAAGVIQRAVKLGAAIKVVYLTNGDNNELAFLVYKKHPVLSRRGLLRMGELRRQEAIKAMDFLGVKQNQLVFLGYPDFGTSEIFKKYWGKVKPYKSMLTKVTFVPYKESAAYRSLYLGDNILKDLKRNILEFKPTKIFVTSPVDTNQDHKASWLFLQTALWDLGPFIHSPQIYSFLIHASKWPLPRGFHPEERLNIPEKLSETSIDWFNFELNREEVLKKKDAIRFYRSQIGYNPKYLYSFARKNELFGNFTNILLHNEQRDVLWQEYGQQQRITSQSVDDDSISNNIVQSVTYLQQQKKLFIKLVVNNWESKLSKIKLHLFGYKFKKDFSVMPKFRIIINFDKFISVYDGRRKIKVHNIKLTHSKNELLLEVPLADLADPDKILTSVETNIADWSFGSTAWRVLIVDKQKIEL